MNEDIYWNAMIQEMDLVESEIWFNINIKQHVTPYELDEAKSKVKAARETIQKKYDNLSRVAAKDKAKREEMIPVLTKILNDRDAYSSDDFTKLEDMMDKEGGVDVKQFHTRKVTQKDVKAVFDQLDSDEYKDLASSVDKLFTKETWKNLGLHGSEKEQEPLEDHQMDMLKHQMKKELDKHPDHAELLEKEYGQSFTKILDEFEAHNKSLQKPSKK